MLILNRRKGESIYIGDAKVTLIRTHPAITLAFGGMWHNVATGRHLSIRPDIHIYVAGRQGAQVRLGIDAPKDVVILREELRK